MKYIVGLFCLGLCLGYAMSGQGQEALRPSKLQLAVEPEEIILTKDIMVGARSKKILLIVRETSSLNPAELELVARPFTDINTGDIVDTGIVTVDIASPQASLEPGGLQRVEMTIGGFRQAGTYVGGITIHDTVSGEQKDVSVRVSVKDSWGLPTLILLGAVLLASGVNYWTQKGRRKNRLDRTVGELQKTVKLAGGLDDPFLFDAEQLLEKAQAYTQEYQFDRAESAIAGAGQKLEQYEQRKQASEQLRQKIQELLHEIRELGEHDPQHSRISDELIQLLPAIHGDYEQIEALVNQLNMFFRAYRLARKDLQTAREKLQSTLEYVKKADKSKIEMYFREIEGLLASAESMTTLDEANGLLRKVAYELSPEKINENIFQEQKMQNILAGYEQQVKQVSGNQVKRIVTTWYDTAKSALEDNRYEDVNDALQKLEKTLQFVDRIKGFEQQMKGRDPKFTECRRILRNCKNTLDEEPSREAMQRVEWNLNQVDELLAGTREQYTPFQPPTDPGKPTEPGAGDQDSEATADGEDERLKTLTREDIQQHVDRILEEAAQHQRLRARLVQWRVHCQKLLDFEELSELSEYLRLIQDELALYTRIQSTRSQAEEKHAHAVLKLVEQAEQLLQHGMQDEAAQEERAHFHRAEVLADAANALLEEKREESDFDQVLSYIRAPKTTSNLITYGTLSSYFVVTTLLGLQILYAPDPDFGALVFKDYFSLVLWALGLEGTKLTVTNVYQAYFKKEG